MKCKRCDTTIANGADVVTFEDEVYCAEPCSTVAVYAKQRIADPLNVHHGDGDPFGHWWIVGVVENASWWIAEATDWAKRLNDPRLAFQYGRPRNHKEAWRFGGGPFNSFESAKTFLRSQFTASLMLGTHGLHLAHVADIAHTAKAGA